MTRVELPKATRVQPQFVHGFSSFASARRRGASCLSLIPFFSLSPHFLLASTPLTSKISSKTSPPNQSPLHWSQETCNVSVNAGLNRAFSNFHYTCRVCESGPRSFSSDLRSQRARQLWSSPHHVTQARDAPHRPTTDRLCSVAAILPVDTHHQRNSSRKIQ